MRLAWVAAMAVLGALASSCGNTCIAGKTEACACTDGRTGAQICRANGTFEPCLCTARLDGGAVDGGDPGCLRNLNAPRISVNDISAEAWRLASGQTVRLAVQVQDFDGDELTNSWSVHARDGGPDAPDASIGGAIGGLDRAAATFTVTAPGSWEIELRTSDGCHAVSHVWPIEVVAAKRLPFALSDVACCDAQGRAFGLEALTAKVMRFDMDAGVDAVQSLPRVSRALSLDAEGERLIVAQDAYVSFFRVADFSREVEWPLGFPVSAVMASGNTAWIYGGSRQGIQLAIDAGTVLAQAQSADPVERGFVSADGGWLVVTDGYSIESLSVRNPFVYASGPGSACSELWANRDRTRFFTGCAKAWELGRDGGLVYAGMLRDQTQLTALTQTSDGNIAATYFMNAREPRMLVVNGSSLGLEFDFPVGLQSSDLRTVVAPSFLLPNSSGGVHALTPDPDNGVTWVQEF